MDRIKSGSLENPSLPDGCSSYPKGEFITGCADIMIGTGTDGTLMRLFYPTAIGDIRTVPRKYWTKWLLGKKYVEGVAYFNAPKVVTLYTETFSRLLKNLCVPAIWEAPVAKAKFPLIVFSHGMTSNRSMSSGLCSDLASQGFIVAALEHRDGSACATFTTNQEGGKDWIFQRIIASDESEEVIRKEQFKIRTEECCRALDVLEKLNSGMKLMNELDSNFDLQTLRNKFDMSSPIMAGHSFGGATTILVLNKDSRFKLGISLDTWLFPIQEDSERLVKSVKQPILFLLMEKFQTNLNLKYLRPFQIPQHEFYSLRKGTHLHFTDVPVLFSKYPVFFQKYLIRPSCYESACLPEVPSIIVQVLIKIYIFKKLGINNGYEEACAPLLKKYDSKINKKIEARANKMIGWDVDW